MSYTYGKAGERTSITYPDGRTVHYGYDEQVRLSEMKEGDRLITYGYDSFGRLCEKQFPNGTKTNYGYDTKDQLTELVHTDREGVLDRYTYLYDLIGNKTGITKERRNLAEESGRYSYHYDELGRLSGIQKDGQMQTSYEYDAFGNRISQNINGERTVYTYNALNQLTEKRCTRSDSYIETYQYDRRGNLTEVQSNGQILHQYFYGALNRLEEAVNQAGNRAVYRYNGLGHRIGKTEGTIPKEQNSSLNPQAHIHTEIGNLKQIDYTIDLTKEYYNLLEKTENDHTQTYFWDGNVTSYEENGEKNYYLQDELGSPLRVQDTCGMNRAVYGYGAFGEDLYGNQGEAQPFGYTGYQKDPVAGTYYAQAREYQADNGRFVGQDVVVGFMDLPFSMNRYSYCFNTPMMLVDLDGAWPQWMLDTGNAIKNFWNNYIYGEEIKYVETDETGDYFGGIYAATSNTNTTENKDYKGSILKKTSYVDGTKDVVREKWSINLPTIDLGKEKSLGIPISIGFFGGTDGIGVDLSLGVDLIAPKVEANASLTLLGEGGVELDGDIGIGWLKNLMGIEIGIPLSPFEKLKLGLFSKSIKNNIESRSAVGVYLKMGVVYVIAVVVVAIYYGVYTGDLQTGINIIRQYWSSIGSIGCIN